MFLIDSIQSMTEAGAQQLLTWITQLLPKVFLFLILLNGVTRLIGRARVEKLAARCGSNSLLRYLVLPFLSAVVLGNPMAISMGRYLPEKYKPAYFASASYHCHTNSGIFQHVNPAELFLWLGIANGVLARGLGVLPLAIRYLAAGLVALMGLEDVVWHRIWDVRHTVPSGERAAACQGCCPLAAADKCQTVGCRIAIYDLLFFENGVWQSAFQPPAILAATLEFRTIYAVMADSRHGPVVVERPDHTLAAA